MLCKKEELQLLNTAVYDKQLHYHHQECHTDVRQARVGEISQQRIRTKGIMMYYRKLSTP